MFSRTANREVKGTKHCRYIGGSVAELELGICVNVCGYVAFEVE